MKNLQFAGFCLGSLSPITITSQPAVCFHTPMSRFPSLKHRSALPGDNWVLLGQWASLRASKLICTGALTWNSYFVSAPSLIQDFSTRSDGDGCVAARAEGLVRV